MSISIKGVVALSLTCIAVDAFATFVSESDVRKAAEAFVSADPIGSAILGERSVADVRESNGIWIVALSPQGHVILCGSDLNDPIVGFSSKDFVDPDPESPAYAVLEGARAAVREKEEKGEEGRNAKWTALLGNGRPMLRASPVDNPSTVIVPNFLQSHYNQCQPYNDYVPVYDSAANTTSYRGRCPCGCVATATAQVFRHFRWPARIDGSYSCDHDFTDTNNVTTSFVIRFDGYTPLEWLSLESDYASYQGGYDLRGKVAESVRSPIARLIMFADVLAGMSFKSNGSSSNYDTVASKASDWYVGGSWVDIEEGVSLVRADMLAGVPCQVSIGAYNQSGQRYKGHEVVAHGWAESGSTKYVYINFGWGGSNDGYYNVAGDFQDYQKKEVYVGHYPRAKPQIDPLPKVCETSLTLNWHFPDFYTNNLSGFTVVASKTATTTSTFLDDFSSSTGVSSSSDAIYVATDSAGYDGNLLLTKPSAAGIYTFPGTYTLTSASVLTFKLYSFAALGATYQIEARFNGGEWTPLCTPALKTDWGASGWSTERMYLGSRGGQTVQFRISNSHSGSFYPQDESRILLDDFRVTEVLAPIAPEIHNVDNAARSLVLTGLASGATYSFVVTPTVTGALVAGESSEPVATSIAGSKNTPIPGEQTYSSQNLVFSTSDTSGVWSYSGTSRSNASIRDVWENSITANISGKITASSELKFKWMAKGLYTGGACDTFSAVFKCNDGTDYDLWSVQNTANKTSAQSVSVSLASYAGKSGKIVISYSHSVSQYTSDTYGGTLSNAEVTNIQVPSVPAVGWKEETKTALGMPEIRSVSSVSEGLYGECWTNTTTFSVVCSGTVETLEARPSHLSLVRDEDVSVSEMGNGKFKVCVTPGGINETNFRSRMILTLVGTDSNGTKCYKDLSLRFSQVEPKPTEVHVAATTSSGDEFSVEIPYSWIESYGLVPSGSDAATYEAALASTADADSDGLPNWAEYVCGTSPTDPAEKLVALITIEDGKPVVTYSPGDSQIAAGFRAVIKGTTDLAAALSTWEVVTETRTSTCRFFRVEIVPEN